MEEIVKEFCVYVHRDMGGDIFYVGMGKLNRPFQVEKYNRSEQWVEHVEKYGLGEIEILRYFDVRNDAVAEETRLTNELFESGIALANIKIGNLYRSRDDNPNCGRQLSEETKSKISVARTGKKASEATKKKLSASMMGAKNHFYGREHSEETKKRISQANTGKKHTPEAREKMSESHEGNKSHFFKGVTIGVHTQTGKIICFDGSKSMRARGFEHSNVYGVINGRLKTYKKFTYYRTEDRSHIQELIDQNNFYDDESGKLLNSFLNT